MKVMIVAPHMDDEALGMGGTIAKHVARGDKISVVIVANRVYSHTFDRKSYEVEKKAALKAKKVLGYGDLLFLEMPDERLDACVQDVIIPLEKAVHRIKPGILYSCFYGDNHQDHRAVFGAVRIIARSATSFKIKRILLYEVPSSTDQSLPMAQSAFLPNFYVNIKSFMAKKLKAVKCYERERRDFPHPRSREGIAVLAQKRGVEAGLTCAEAFMIMRDEWV